MRNNKAAVDDLLGDWQLNLHLSSTPEVWFFSLSLTSLSNSQMMPSGACVNLCRVQRLRRKPNWTFLCGKIPRTKFKIICDILYIYYIICNICYCFNFTNNFTVSWKCRGIFVCLFAVVFCLCLWRFLNWFCTTENAFLPTDFLCVLSEFLFSKL